MNQSATPAAPPPVRLTAAGLQPIRALTSVAETAWCYPLDLIARPAEPAGVPGTSAVVLVPGYGGVPGHLEALRRALVAAGFGPVVTMRYSHLRPDVRSLAAEVVRLCDEIRAQRPGLRIHLVGHSLGGVVMRYATEVLRLGSDGSVGVGVTVATPHRGAPFALWATTGLGGWTGIDGGLQLLPDSALLREIDAAAESNESPIDWLAFSSDGDVVVPPRRADLAGAENIRLHDDDHFSILRSPQLIASVVRRLQGNDERCERPASVAVGPPAHQYTEM